MALKDALHEVIAYFMTEYPTNSPRQKVDTAVAAYLELSYRPEFVSQFLSTYGKTVRDTLVSEYNSRIATTLTLRFQFLDASGEIILGIGYDREREKIAFQDAINSLVPADFERLTAFILGLAGCEEFWSTPESHDQGLDGFGYRTFISRDDGQWQGATPRVVMLAQAKHYREVKVGSKEVRELVGTMSLAEYKIYSTLDDKYTDLEIRPYSPRALILTTSEEVAVTVKRMAINAGIVLLSSDDLYDVLITHWGSSAKRRTKSWFTNRITRDTAAIERAR